MSKNFSGNSFYRSHMGKSAGVFLATGFMLNLGAYADTNVPENASLYGYLIGSTALSHTFNLDGNVFLNQNFVMNNANLQKVIINGNGHEINTNAFDSKLWVNIQFAELSVLNATLTSGNLYHTQGAISIYEGMNDAKLSLNGTKFVENTGGNSAHYSGGLTVHGARTTVSGAVVFERNHGFGAGSGALAMGNSGSLTFENSVVFDGNYSDIRGGAIGVYSGGSVTFQSAAEFTGNHSNRRGGAIGIDSTLGMVTFQNGALFDGNYVRSDTNDGASGGAIVIGFEHGNNSPLQQLNITGTATFSDNYVWSDGNRFAQGGAIALIDRSNGDSVDIPVAQRVYGFNIEQGIFTNNYAYSQTGTARGGAIYSGGSGTTMSFGSGTVFTGNMASSLGGAIYFNQGTINLIGNVTFSGNRQGVTFSTAGDTLTPDLNSGTANAIYFRQGNSPATLNLDVGDQQMIDFADPIQSQAGRVVAVNQIGDGTVRFSVHNSDILAKTTVGEGGTFELKDGASYGRVETGIDSSFTLDNDARLLATGGGHDDRGLTLRASAFNLNGRVEVGDSVLKFEGGDLLFSSVSTIALTIVDSYTFSSIDAGGRAVSLNDATLEINAIGYLPSQDVSDTFTIVANLADEPLGFFSNGNTVVINGALFDLFYDSATKSIVLSQSNVPEPSTYALLLAIGCVGGAWARRQRQKGKKSAGLTDL